MNKSVQRVVVFRVPDLDTAPRIVVA
jgi:hypothetical protein